MTNNLRRQIADILNRGEGLIAAINFLMTCDYNKQEIVKMLVEEFGYEFNEVTDIIFNNY